MRVAAGAIHKVGDAGPSKLTQGRIGRDGAATPRPFRIPFDLITRAGYEFCVARLVRKRGAMRVGVGNERIAAIEWRIKPLVTIVGPRVRQFDPPQEVPVLGARSRP